MAEALRLATETMPDCEIELRTEFLDDLSPQNVASRMLALGAECDAVGVVAAVHPLVTQAVDALHASNVTGVCADLADSATGHVRYIGLDNWKVGRTAAWVFGACLPRARQARHPCRQSPLSLPEMNESGFRSYFREHAPEFTLLEPLLTFESSAIAQEMTEKLLNENPDLSGLYVAGAASHRRHRGPTLHRSRRQRCRRRL